MAKNNFVTAVLSRQDANRKIVETISAMVEKYPSLRFGQLLQNLDINIKASFVPTNLLEDTFYEESTMTLDRVKGVTEKVGL